jgi:DNA-directed RNA polymerase alpha subunit
MSAVIIPFPNEKARELLLNGYYRPQDDRQSARDKLLAWCDKVEYDQAAREAESREYSKRLAALRAAGVPHRCLWSLAADGYSTLADIARLNVDVLDKARNVGPKTIRELKALLLNNGINPDPSWEE